MSAAEPIVLGRQVYKVEQYHKCDMAELLATVKRERRTGALTLHFNSGEVSTLEWKQKQKPIDLK